MTTDSVFILFKKIEFNTILACLGGKVNRWWGVIKFLLPKYIGGRSFKDTDFSFNLGPPLPKKMPAP